MEEGHHRSLEYAVPHSFMFSSFLFRVLELLNCRYIRNWTITKDPLHYQDRKHEDMSVSSNQGYLLAKRESSTRLRIRVRHPSAYKKRMRLAKKLL